MKEEKVIIISFTLQDILTGSGGFCGVGFFRSRHNCPCDCVCVCV